MSRNAVKHAVLRDGERWEGAFTGLRVAAGGRLSLARFPGAEPPLEPLPVVDLGYSGVDAGECGALVVSDTAQGQVLVEGAPCGRRAISGVSSAGHPAGVLSTPAAVRLAGDRLYIADAGNARIVVLRFPSLDTLDVWEGPLRKPVDLALDSAHRVYVLDVSLRQVLRFLPSGTIDDEFAPSAASVTEPAYLAIDDVDRLYVSDAAEGAVFVLSSDGALVGALRDLEAETPRALAAHGPYLYVADAASGLLRAYSLPEQLDHGALPGFRGPVTGLSAAANGDLVVKASLDGRVLRLLAETGCARRGTLRAGPLDAGERGVWERAVVDADEPSTTSVSLAIHVTSGTTAPVETDWVDAPVLDTLVPPPELSRNSDRFLWLRVTLTSEDGVAAPGVEQVRAHTTRRSWLDYLPRVYRREDDGFLARYLALFQSELDDVSTALDELHRLLQAATTPPETLEWLGTWVACEAPAGLSGAKLRALVDNAHERHTRRGTRRGLVEAVELHTGLTPAIVEAYRGRLLWQLDHTARLGVDTGLAPAHPEGAVVPDPREGFVVGEAVVGQTGPQDADAWARALFTETSHLFSVVVPAHEVKSRRQLGELRRVLEAEKPAHTDCHLCLVRPRMRVGFQARVGIDSIVACGPSPFTVATARLDVSTMLGGEEHSRVGLSGHIGRGIQLG